MAGAGYKLFNTGDVLTAAQVNTYLQEQAVMVFANAAARTTALSGVLAEGMITYLKDTDAVEKYDGSSWVSIGGSSVPTSYGFTAGKNIVLNGDFSINQRAFSSTTNNGLYTFDRWITEYSGGTVTYSSQAFTPGTAPVSGYESANFYRVVTSSQTLSSHYAAFNQRIENVRLFAGQAVTVSFWAKAGSGTPKLAASLQQNFGSGGSPSASVTTAATAANTISTSWARYSFSITLPSLSGKTIGTTANTSYLSLAIWASAGSDYNAITNSIGLQNNTFDIWGVQVEAGSSATTFQTATGTLSGELAACQRYYYRVSNSAGDRLGNWGYAGTTSTVRLFTPLPVNMRIKPTALEQSGTAGDYGIAYAATGIVCTSVPTFLNASTNHAATTFTVSTTPFTVGAGAEGYAQNATGYLGWSAEL